MKAGEMCALTSNAVAAVSAGQRPPAGIFCLAQALRAVAGKLPRGRLTVAVAAVICFAVGLEGLAGEADVVGRAAALGAEVGGAVAAAYAVAAVVLGSLGGEGLPRRVGLAKGGFEVGGRGGGVDKFHHYAAGGVGAGEEVVLADGEAEG